MLVLLTSWLSIAELDETPYDILETFAGVAQIARAGRLCNMKAAATDLAYEAFASRKGGMDLTTPAGFVFFRSNYEACRCLSLLRAFHTGSTLRKLSQMFTLTLSMMKNPF